VVFGALKINKLLRQQRMLYCLKKGMIPNAPGRGATDKNLKKGEKNEEEDIIGTGARIGHRVGDG
jgi:hypothetical protein